MDGIQKGDTVLLKAPAGQFLRREIQHGIVTDAPDAGFKEQPSPRTVRVTWANGNVSDTSPDALILVKEPSAETRGRLLSYVAAPYPGGSRAQGVIVGAFQDGGTSQDYVIVESTLGLLFLVPVKEVRPVEGK